MILEVKQQIHDKLYAQPSIDLLPAKRDVLCQYGAGTVKLKVLSLAMEASMRFWCFVKRRAVELEMLAELPHEEA
eukprot:4662534-Lingulodinium_polyedra.AAC.1